MLFKRVVTRTRIKIMLKRSFTMLKQSEGKRIKLLIIMIFYFNIYLNQLNHAINSFNIYRNYFKENTQIKKIVNKQICYVFIKNKNLSFS